jgi:antitoxin component of RelBE/YafQ-DinJ toxin-antitoxin module
MTSMANVAVTFNADEAVTQNFERACADMGMSVSAGFNILMRVALREQRLLFGETNISQGNITTFQQQQRNAAYDFIASNHATDDTLSDADYAELENGKYAFKLELDDRHCFFEQGYRNLRGTGEKRPAHW